MADERIWYGFCTFWTDDWGRLGRITGEHMNPPIPCCPECASVGFEVDADEWWEGVQAYEAENPGYYKFIKVIKNTCYGKGISISDLWQEQKGRG